MLARADGRILATATRPATLRSPHQGWAEADPEEWWRNVRSLVPELLDHRRIEAAAIAGIGVAGMLPAVVLLDAGGGVLRPSIQQSDGRTGAEVEAMRGETRRGRLYRAHRQRHQPAARRHEAPLAGAPRARH